MVRFSSPVAAAVIAGWLLTGCSGDSEPEPSPTGPETPASTSSEQPEEIAFDCASVAAAQQALSDATTAELERLGIDRTAPEAFTVVLLTTSQGAAEYWEAVSGATTETAGQSLRDDLAVVARYWAELEEPLAAIEVADSSPAAVQAASDEFVAVSQSRPDEALAPAQQRIQDELAETCGTEPAPAPRPSSS